MIMYFIGSLPIIRPRKGAFTPGSEPAPRSRHPIANWSAGADVGFSDPRIELVVDLGGARHPDPVREQRIPRARRLEPSSGAMLFTSNPWDKRAKRVFDTPSHNFGALVRTGKKWLLQLL
jgi:hypothetical protein